MHKCNSRVVVPLASLVAGFLTYLTYLTAAKKKISVRQSDRVGPFHIYYPNDVSKPVSARQVTTCSMQISRETEPEECGGVGDSSFFAHCLALAVSPPICQSLTTSTRKVKK